MADARISTRAWVAAAAVAVAGAAVLVVLAIRGDGGDDSAGRVTAPESATTVVTGAPTTAISPTTATTSVGGRTTTAPAAPTTSPGARYVGLRHEGGDVVAERVTLIGGALVGDTDLAVTWVDTPTGEMLWLDRAVSTTPDGSVAQWEVLDAIVLPERAADDVVIIGGAVCEIGGEEQVGIVAVFPSTGAEWYTGARRAWQVGAAAGRFEPLDPLDAEIRCLNEGAGV